jgi:hypothetical protein
MLVFQNRKPPTAANESKLNTNATPSRPRRRSRATTKRSRRVPMLPRTQNATDKSSSASSKRPQYPWNHSCADRKWPYPFMSEYGAFGQLPKL